MIKKLKHSELPKLLMLHRRIPRRKAKAAKLFRLVLMMIRALIIVDFMNYRLF
ncbi:unnamed protein product [Gongylonema pulchrum]|uniref:Uncharacterized protein n=1 Tax=Gongylonema pulchrum TaxID=637853 RepID=A0A183EQM5_9BILA|nr:unnamed protein product [Gongylonema pulchrum]